MDMKQIKTLLQEFDASSLSKLKISEDNFSIELEKNIGAVATVVTAAAPATVAAPAVAAVPVAETAAAPATISGDVIVSPMVGTFYSSPSPDSAPFVKAGDIVKKGQVIAILEAMKIMNELEAEFDCKIVNVLVSDAQAVEYDMPLFAVEKM